MASACPSAGASITRLNNRNSLVTELGLRPRRLEISPPGNIVLEVPLQPETDNLQTQTRRARRVRNGMIEVTSEK